MNYPWIDAYLTSKKGAVKEFKLEWEVFRYMIGDKMFAIQGLDNKGKEILTLKLEPTFGQYLREKYPSIEPGYYMNKVHWNSMDLNGDVPDDIVRKMIDQSYECVLQSFSKKKQLALLSDETIA